MKEAYADYIIQKTKHDYDVIAEHFDLSRVKTLAHHVRAWEGMDTLLDNVQSGDKVLDFGCGNGRLFGALKEKHIDYTGVDQSRALIERARKLYPGGRFFCAPGLPVPFPAHSFDVVFSVAVLHHIPSAKKRKEATAELARVLRPKGNIMLTVWNLWQTTYLPQIASHTAKKIAGMFLPRFCENAQLDFFDIFMPWKDQSQHIVTQRYYHCFLRKEFEHMVCASGLHIEKSGYFGGRDGRANMYIVARK